MISHVEPLERRALFAAGQLDPNFAIAGRYTLDTADGSAALAQQPNGYIISAGDGKQDALVRLTPQGTRDDTFVYPAALVGRHIEFHEVRLLPDGRVLAAGLEYMPLSPYTQKGIVCRFTST